MHLPSNCTKDYILFLNSSLMNHQPFSVLLSVYQKEDPSFFSQALDSIFHQSAMPDEVVVVKDGPLTPALDDVLATFCRRYDILKVISQETNLGLGLSLANGVVHCSHELIARMDTDDISREDRFEKQLYEFQQDPELDICGSHELEFEDSPEHIVAKREVPLTDQACKKYQRRRDAFNHVTVMFKKSAVLRAGNYQHCPLMEDSLLWVNMFMTGAKAKNIDDYLVYVRIGQGMYERRGGRLYFKKYKQARKTIYETGFVSWWDYAYTLIVQFIVAFIPNRLRGWLFKNILHR